MKNVICLLGAKEISAKIKQGELSVRQVLEAYLQRAEDCGNELNCFNLICKDYALSRAEEVQKGIDDGALSGPLAGVPIAVKDNICTEGIPTTCSSRMLSDFVPPYNATVINKINAEGLVVFAKLNMDEFAMGSTNESSFFGEVRNPWNLSRVPGGSSGGAAAAVSAGLSPLALATDTGGSVRQPCSFCSVTGLKPTYGAVSRYGLIAYASSLDTIGAIAKSADDCLALFNIIRGSDPKDSTSKDASFIKSTDIKGKKIAVISELLSEDINPEVKNAVLSAAERFRSLGAETEFISVPELKYSVEAYYVLASAQASYNLARFDGISCGYTPENVETLSEQYLKSRSAGFGSEVKRRILLGNFVLSEGYYDSYYKNALKAQELIKQALKKALGNYSFILTPVSPDTAPEIGKMTKDPMKMYLSDVCTVPANLAGLPAVAFPCGFDKDNMPIGVQLIGNAFCEEEIMSAAEAFQQKTKYHKTQPPFTARYKK